MVNAPHTFGIDPAMGHIERALALSYAPRASRDSVAALFALDATLARIVRTTRDPFVAQMRLTWWYEALVALDTAAPPAQPILQALHVAVMPRGVTGTALAGMIDGWEALLDPGGDMLDTYAVGRGEVLFAAAAKVTGGTGPSGQAGRGWAFADLALTSPDPALVQAARVAALPLLARSSRWSRDGRALGALALVARMDLAARAAPGAPRRVARLAWHRLTGV